MTLIETIATNYLLMLIVPGKSRAKYELNTSKDKAVVQRNHCSCLGNVVVVATMYAAHLREDSYQI